MWVLQAIQRRRRKKNDRAGQNTNCGPTVRVTARSRRQQQPVPADENEEAMPLLYSLARGWAWEAVIFRCQTHPDEVFCEADYHGDTLLHICCIGRPPVAAVAALLDVCPDLAKQRNNNGSLPLHLACSYRAPTETIQAIIDAYPRAAGIATYNTGFTPLHCVCNYGGCLPVIRALLQTPAGMASVVTTDKTFLRTPLQILNARKNMRQSVRDTEQLRHTRRKQRSYRQDKGSVNDWLERGGLIDAILERLEDEIRPLKHVEFWLTTSLLMVAQYQHIRQPQNPHLPVCMLQAYANEQELVVLHAFVGNPECAPSLQEHAILLFEPLLLVPNSRGQLALHLAAANYCVDCRPETSSQLLLQLLAAHPTAACVRDSDGCFPLSLAVRTPGGICWTEGLGSLIDANPLALLEDDIGLVGRGGGGVMIAHILPRLSAKAMFLICQAIPDLLTRHIRNDERVSVH